MTLLNASDFNELSALSLPSRTYRISRDRVAGFVDGIESIKQSVNHILSTERYAYPIYGTNYGVELQQFIGESFDYIEANIETIITEALLQDDRIDNVVIDDIKKTNSNSLQVKFTVISNLGSFSEEVLIGE